jgi:3-dehydroquinate dehydratase type I
MSYVCVTIMEETVSDLLVAAEKSKSLGANLLELRMDYLKEPLSDVDFGHLTELKDELRIPVIFTLRPSWEGGKFDDTEEKRVGFLEQAIRAKFDYIDLEMKMDGQKRDELIAKAKENDVKVIVSHHDFEKTPSWSEIFAIMKHLADTKCYITKAAFKCESYDDVLNILKGGRASININQPFSVMGMGSHGHITRIFAPFIGCSIMYASLDREKRVDEGQVDIKTLVELWDATGCI